MPAFLFDPFCPCQSNGLMTLILKEIKMSSATACQGQTSCNVKKPRCKGEDEGGSPACAFWRAACYTSAKKEHTIWGHFFGHCHSFKQYGSQTWNLMSEHCHCSAVWLIESSKNSYWSSSSTQLKHISPIWPSPENGVKWVPWKRGEMSTLPRLSSSCRHCACRPKTNSDNLGWQIQF